MIWVKKNSEFKLTPKPESFQYAKRALMEKITVIIFDPNRKSN